MIFESRHASTKESYTHVINFFIVLGEIVHHYESKKVDGLLN